MSIVVLGATGNLGRLVLKNLLSVGENAENITAAGRNTAALSEFEAAGVKVVAVDYSQPETLPAALEGADTVLLISGNDIAHRRAQHAAVVEAAKTAGVKKLAYTSVLDAQESPLALAPDHKETEDLIMESGLEYVFFRNGWYTENYVPTVQAAAQSGEIIGNAGTGKVASAPRADFAEAIANALHHGGNTHVYELGGHPAWDYQELAAVATEILGRQVDYRNVTAEEHLKLLKEAGVGEGAAFQVSIDKDIAAGWLDTDSNDLEKLLGRPTTPLKAALQAALS